MTTVNVLPLPQTAPISDMRNRQNEILQMTENGPVVLLSRSKPAAVLLSPSYWNAIASALESYQRYPEPGEQSMATGDANSEYTATEEIDALAEIAALAQPLGPADLARNFDIYTHRVIDDEPVA